MVPPTLAACAESSGQIMPDGLYCFYGSSAVRAILAELNFHNEHHSGSAPPWDLGARLKIERQGRPRHPNPSQMWKDPRVIQGAYIGVGKTSKETNDLLRFFTGERYALDRLTLEPWRIDAYAAVLQQVYGQMKVVVFDALMADNRIETIARIYDPSILPEGFKPLYRWLSREKAGQSAPTVFHMPGAEWSGWGVPAKALSADDSADILSYASQPANSHETREALFARRLKMLRAEGRFEPDDRLSEIVERRLAATTMKGVKKDGDSNTELH